MGLSFPEPLSCAGGPDPDGARAQQVRDAAQRLSAALAVDGGTIEVESLTPDGRVSVRLGGACIGCPLRPLTMGWLVRPALLEVPGVREVVHTGLALSEFAEARIRRLYDSYQREPRSAR